MLIHPTQAEVEERPHSTSTLLGSAMEILQNPVAISTSVPGATPSSFLTGALTSYHQPLHCLPPVKPPNKS